MRRSKTTRAEETKATDAGSACVFRYEFENLSFKDVIAFSRDHLSRIAYFDIDPLGGECFHHIGMQGRLLGESSVATMWCSPGKATRTLKHVAESASDNVVLVMPLTTPEAISRKGHDDFVCRPGEVFIWPGDEPLSFGYGEDCAVLCIAMPRASVPTLAPRLMTCVGLSDAPGIKLLRSQALGLLEEDGLPDEALRLSADYLRDLTILSLGANRDEREQAARGKSLHAARLAAIKADIAAHLSDSELSLDWLSKRHQLSERAIRNLFYAEGEGFVDHVINMRLEKARSALLDPAAANHTVAMIAHEAGFGDISWFNRKFVRRFGVTPTEMRAGSGAIIVQK